MIGRRAVVGLSLLSALLFCAFAAQSASAVEAKNTTAFTCVSGGGSKDFKDAHCDEFLGAEKGSFGHVEIAKNVETKVTVTNAKTKTATTEAEHASLTGSPFKVATEITCEVVSGSGFIKNVEPKANVHNVEGTITTEFTKCKVFKPAKCTVKEPIVTKTPFVGVEEIGPKPEEKTMGLEFKPEPEAGKVFTAITLQGAECPIKEPFNVEGTAIATGTPNPKEKFSGATTVFTEAMTKETLTAAARPAEFTATVTTSMEGAGGNPITLTTPT